MSSVKTGTVVHKLSTYYGRRNVLTTWKTAAATVGHGRCNALAFANCLCRNSGLFR